MLRGRVFRFQGHLICLLILFSTQIAAISSKETILEEQNVRPITNHSNADTGAGSGRDIVLIIDTSASMAYETSGSLLSSDAGDDPSVCNLNNTCQPMATVKSAALDLVDQLSFPLDRVSIVTMTSQTAGGSRTPMQVLPLSTNKTAVQTAINSIKVFEPPVCNGTSTSASGVCRFYDSGSFVAMLCEFYQMNGFSANRNPSGCPSSNVGGTLALAGDALTGSGDPDMQRLDAFWIVIALLGGPANATDSTATYPNGFCPANTYQSQPWCRDKQPSVRHLATDPLVNYTNPENGVTTAISLYDADDYARDMADNLATLRSGDGVTIFTVGFGSQITSTSTVLAGENPAGEDLLTYIATCAGEDDLSDCSDVTEEQINHGQYFYAPTSSTLADIFTVILQDLDTTAPNVTAFTVPASPTTLDIPITTFTASDDTAVTGYLITESNTPPSSSDPDWTGSAPTTYATGNLGNHTLYPWAKDAAGNVSAVYGSPASVNITCLNEITVTSNDNSGVGTLRQAIADSCSNGVIDFDSSLSGDTIYLASTLSISKNLTIDGSSLSSQIIISGDSDNDGDGDILILNINTDISAVLKNLKFTKGYSPFGTGVGAIENLGNLSIYDSQFESNSAGQGGAIRNSDVMYVENSIFVNNTANYGGAIFNIGMTEIKNSTIISNSATTGGGGIVNSWDSNGSVEITNSIISNNSSSYGGGVFNFPVDENITMENTTLSNNEALNHGGGVSNFGTLLIKNVTAFNNSANLGGGVFSTGVLTANNSTFSENSATNGGGGIANFGTLNYTNTIIANSLSGGDCTNDDSISTNINNLVEDGGCTAALSSDPMLAPLADNGGLTQTMALLLGSPAIDAGDAATCESTDQRGLSRPQGIVCDIGAFEYFVKDITAFSFTSPAATGTITGANIAVTVPFGTNRNGLIANFTTTGTSVKVGATTQVNGTTANDFTSPVTYTVTAADATTKEYIVTVTVAQNPAKDITAFSFTSPAATGTITGTNIAVTVPFGTNRNGLIANFTTTGTSVKVGATTQVSGATANDYTNPVTFTVTAADATTKDYIVTVMVAQNPAKDITAFSFTSPAATGTITGTNIAVTVPFGTNRSALVASFTTTGTSVKVGSTTQVSGTTTNDFTSPVTYTVTAADDTTQDYIVTVNLASGTGSTPVDIYIGTTKMDTTTIAPLSAYLKTFPGINGGPVFVDSTNNVPSVSSLRLLYNKKTFSELMGVPTSQLSNDYWLPYYANIPGTDTQIRFTNTHASLSTTVNVYLGDNPTPVYTKVLAASSTDRFNLPSGTKGGPVHIVGTVGINILAGMRVIYGGNSSFDELMAFPTAQLGTEYWFPFYNHNNINLDTELRVANTSSTTSAPLAIYIGDTLMQQTTIAPLSFYAKSFPGVNGGPVRVVSTSVTPVPVVASLRLLYNKKTFSELMGVPTGQLSNDYWLPYYANIPGTDTQLRFTNTDPTLSTTVNIYLGDNPVAVYTKTLLPKTADRINLPSGTTGGPVHIVGTSGVDILAGMRVIYGGNSSFDELSAYPTALLSAEYWFPFYNHNNINLDTQVRIGVP